MQDQKVLNAAIPGPDEDPTTSKVVAFVLGATRRAKRAAIKTKDVTWMGLKFIGNGVLALIPYLVVAAVAAVAIAALAASFWITLSFFQYLYATSPVAYYVLMGGVILQFTGAFGLRKLFQRRKLNTNVVETTGDLVTA